MTRPITRVPQPGDIVRSAGGGTWRVDQVSWDPDGRNRSHLTMTLDRWVAPGAPLLTPPDDDVAEIDDQLQHAADALRHSINASIEEARRQGIDPYAMISPAGAPVLGPMYAALGQILAVQAQLR